MNNSEDNNEEFEEVYSVVEILEEEDENDEKQGNVENEVDRNHSIILEPRDNPVKNESEEIKTHEKKEDIIEPPHTPPQQVKEVDLLIRKTLNRRIYSGKRMKAAPCNIVRPIERNLPEASPVLPEKDNFCDVCKTKFIDSHSCSIKLPVKRPKSLSYCHLCDLKLENSEKLIQHFNNGHRNLQCFGCTNDFGRGIDFYIHIYEKLFGVKPEMEIDKKSDESKSSPVPIPDDNLIIAMTEDIMQQDWSKFMNGIEDGSFELPPAKRALIDLDLEDNISLSNIQLDEDEFKNGMKVIGFKIELDDDIDEYECLQQDN